MPSPPLSREAARAGQLPRPTPSRPPLPTIAFIGNNKRMMVTPGISTRPSPVYPPLSWARASAHKFSGLICSFACWAQGKESVSRIWEDCFKFSRKQADNSRYSKQGRGVTKRWLEGRSHFPHPWGRGWDTSWGPWGRLCTKAPRRGDGGVPCSVMDTPRPHSLLLPRRCRASWACRPTALSTCAEMLFHVHCCTYTIHPERWRSLPHHVRRHRKPPVMGERSSV